jgi:hypothetical protein
MPSIGKAWFIAGCMAAVVLAVNQMAYSQASRNEPVTESVHLPQWPVVKVPRKDGDVVGRLDFFGEMQP